VKDWVVVQNEELPEESTESTGDRGAASGSRGRRPEDQETMVNGFAG